jgi:2-polyprenyl-3-methyl-5-hydroxy-6-metoxy-1,4-benzoquinol methylase
MNSSDYQSYFESNKDSWNKRTIIHRDSSFYGVQEFKEGKTSLTRIELEELGDVKGKSLLHLQCHFGMDTLSWARLGAQCTGVDLSDEAIKTAKELNNELGLEAKFICCNVYDLKNHLDGKFDIVFTSYGTIGWLPDLDKWAEIISYYLKPGGIFYIADFHPVLWMMDEDFSYIKYSYFNAEVIVDETEGTYSNRDAPIKTLNYGWNHPFADILNNLIKHGLQILYVNEFPFSPFNCFNNLEQGSDGMWRIRGMNEKLPMMYSIKARKL